MITKTNFQMLQELLKTFRPAEKSVLSSEEVAKIRTTLCIPEQEVLSLRNLRDFTVLFLSNKEDENIDYHDIMSGIVHVIDLEILNKGGDVCND